MDFVVLNMEKDVNIPIIFSKPFLATIGTITDVKIVTLNFKSVKMW